jgi:hypothetical protein
LSAEAKKQEKAAEKLAKEAAKDQAAREKQVADANRHANKLKQKFECTEDLTVFICQSVDEAHGVVLIPALHEAGAKTQVQQMKIEGAVTWQRNVTREWFEDFNECICNSPRAAMSVKNRDGEMGTDFPSSRVSRRNREQRLRPDTPLSTC